MEVDYGEPLVEGGGVWKRLHKQGTSLYESGSGIDWSHPEDGDEVLMHYTGRLASDNSEFDSSRKRGDPLKFELGKKSVISGWEIAARTMSKGEISTVTLSPQFAYGEAGSPPKIPPNATLVFEMELVGWICHRDLFADGSAIKTVLAEGDGWERPSKLSQVTAELAVYTDENMNVSYFPPQEVTFSMKAGDPVLNGNQLIEAVVKDMKKNGHVKVVARGSRCEWPGKLSPGLDEAVYSIKLLNWLKVEDVSKDGGVLKKVLREGDGWERPNEGAICVLNATCYFIRGGTQKQMFDSYENRTIGLYDGDLLDALEDTILTMKRGERALVSVDSAHGFVTCKSIKPLAVEESDALEFELELVSFQRAKETWSMSFEEKIEVLKQRKTKGNELFKASRPKLAMKSYERAIGFFEYSTSELSPEMRKEVNVLLVQCHLNMAACYEQLGDGSVDKVLHHCGKALDLEPSNVKALYRQAGALMKSEEYIKAEACLKHALEVSPGNAAVTARLKQNREKQKAQDARDKRMFKTMFSKLQDENGHASDRMETA
eukprot:CAMPEP_0182452450 /NCGR_PEP_ID=MMETSP1172-20130603/44251_1 /TAXON_ID=708627 /ORGANISM="Timspurckia oligopyrenoides, Strain CCMP3278" /LENGTH=545 /DNA_ID=CAMNT_0024650283 /DNA_START=133 /DNA_END=1770 /DNA_ORIENTATION=+